MKKQKTKTLFTGKWEPKMYQICRDHFYNTTIQVNVKSMFSIN